MSAITTFPPLFGTHRSLRLPPIEPVDVTAADGTALRLYHVPAGGPKAGRGVVLLAPGTAMTGLSFCVDTVRCNLAETLHAEGFDVWLFDWRSSPLLGSHKQAYTLDDVARYDWPAAVAAVRAHTGASRISVFAHCLSSPSLCYALLRGYLPTEALDAIVASQVALHFELPLLGKLKTQGHVDLLLPEQQMIHLRPEDVTLHFADAAISALAAVLPTHCERAVCHRHSATFGNLVQHSRLSEETHALLGELIPEVHVSFLRDVAPHSRHASALREDDERHLQRLALPITLISGEHNETFIPAATELSFHRLCAENGPALYRRHVVAGYGHLDCLLGSDADRDVYPLIVDALGPSVRSRREAKVSGTDGGV